MRNERGSVIAEALGVILLLLLLTSLTLLAINDFARKSYEEVATVILHPKINKAISVKSVKNCVTQYVGLGGGTGLASTEIHCYSLEQFIKETEECSQIYTCVEQKRNSLIRKYAALTEKGAGIIIYEEPVIFSFSEEVEEMKNNPLLIKHRVRIKSFDDQIATAVCRVELRRWF